MTLPAVKTNYIICLLTTNFGGEVYHVPFNCGYIGKIGILGTFFGYIGIRLIPWPTLTNERTKVAIQQSNFQVSSSKSCHVLISFYTLHTVKVDLLQLFWKKKVENMHVYFQNKRN